MTGILDFGTWLDPNGRPRTGVGQVWAVDAVTGASIPLIVDSDGHQVYTGPIDVQLSAGAHTQPLPGSDDPQLNPSGFPWRVQLTLDDGTEIDRTLEVPLDATVYLTDELDPPNGAPTYTARVNEAAGYATAAAGSAGSAAGSATTAAQRAAAALAAQTAAEGAETGALAAQMGAEAAENNAEDQAVAAAASAASAAGAVSSEVTRATTAESALRNLTDSTFSTGLNNAIDARLAGTWVDNGDGTATLASTIITDNGDGTATIAA